MNKDIDSRLEAVRLADRAAREAFAELSEVERTFTVVAHIISSDATKGTFTGRLVLKDEEGYFAAVLAVGEPVNNYNGAIDSVVQKFGKAMLAVVGSTPEGQKDA
jgi:hypothetical protein